MRATFRQCETQMGRVMAEMGVPLSYYYILRLEWDLNGFTQVELSNEAVMTPSVASQVIRKMCQGEFLTREASPDDLRVKNVHITPKGRILKDSLNSVCEEILSRAFGDIPVDDIATATEVLKGLQVNIQNLSDA